MRRPYHKGYVKLRRGIAEHLPGLSAHACKLFFVVLVNAVPTGSRRGILAASVAELVKLSGIRRQTLLLAAEQLEGQGWITVAKAKNQHATTEWRVTKFDVSEQDETAGAESGTSETSAGNEFGTSKSGLPVTEADPAVYESGTSNPSNQLNPFELQAPKNLKKDTTYPRKKRDSSKDLGDGLQPWAVCKAIAEAGGLDFVKPNGRSLKEAKTLLQACPELTADDVRAITLDLLAIDDGRFWNVKAPVTPAQVERHLPLWRKRKDCPKVQPISQSAPPLDLASAWAQEAR